MKIVDAHYTFDRARMVVTFGAEGRVVFRLLIHALSSATGGRVELCQVGDRDVTKLTGGIGRCGMTLCCVRVVGQVQVHLRPDGQGAGPAHQRGWSDRRLRKTALLPAV